MDGRAGHRLARRRDRSLEGRDLPPVGPAGGGGDGPAVRDDHSARVARARPVVQGAVARHGRARGGQLRVARLPRAASRGHHDRAGGARPGGPGPGRAPRALPRDRPTVQRALRRRPGGAAAPALGDPADPGQRRTQDVQVARQLHRHPRRARRDPRQGALVHHRPPEGAPRRSRTPGDLPDLRAAPPLLARGRRPDRGDLPHGGAELRRLQDAARRQPDRSIPAIPRTTSRERRAELERDPSIVQKVLADGAARVRPVAQETLAAVRSAMHYA